MDDISTVKSLFEKVSQSDFNKWLDTQLPKFKLKTPREMIRDGKTEEVISLLSNFLPKPKMP